MRVFDSHIEEVKVNEVNCVKTVEILTIVGSVDFE